MTSQWRIRAFDVAIACELAGRDTVPYPLSIGLRRMSAGEYRAARNDAAERLHTMEPDFFTALRVLARPDLRIAVRSTRMLAYVAEASGFTAVAFQDRDGGDVTIRLTTSTASVAALRVVPAADPGKRRRLEGPTTSAEITDFLGAATSNGTISAALGHRGNVLGWFRWIDARDGRYVVTERGNWTTIAPATRETIANELSLLVRTAVADVPG